MMQKEKYSETNTDTNVGNKIMCYKGVLDVDQIRALLSFGEDCLSCRHDIKALLCSCQIEIYVRIRPALTSYNTINLCISETLLHIGVGKGSPPPQIWGKKTKEGYRTNKN